MFGFSIRTRQNQNNAAPAAPAVPAAASPRTTSSPRVPGSPAATNSPRHVGTPGAKNSPKQVEVGEIDTRAPFRSVKAAVNLFREASNSSPKAAPTVVKKTTKAPDERVLVKETQLHLIMKELDSLKEQLRNTEATKTQAHKDLERAKRTLNELTGKLETICEAKQAAIEATELAKVRAEELEMVQKSGGDDAWKELVDNEREQYKFSAGALNFAKQELANLRQDFDAVLEAKLAAFQQVGDSQHATSVNRERESEFSKEVAALRQTLAQVKLAPLQAQQENAKLNSEREAHLESLKAAKQEADQKLKALRELEESHPAFSKTLAAKLEETNATMDVLREQLNNVKISDIADWRDASSELENSKKGLEQLHAEQVSLKILVDSLKVELENVNALRCELRSKAAETDSMAERLEFELDRSKKELEATLARAIKPEGDDITPKILELSSEAERALLGAEEMKKSAETYRQDAEKARAVAQEAETNLEIALKELEEAKAAQKVADYRIHSASKKFAAEAATSSDSSSGNGRIKLSAEEYESLSNKVEELKSEADIKVATAMAQVQTLNASEKELDEKLEECMKQKEEVQAAIQETLKRAEMDEAAKLVLECELLKWRQKGHNENEVGESSSVGRSEKKIIQMN